MTYALIGLVLSLVSLVADANTLNCFGVVSSGVGHSYEDAKYKAFREAIEKHAGVIIVSESEVKKYNLVKNEIFSYSAHYIDNFKVLNHEINRNKHVVVIEACVSSTRIANRILSRGDTVTTIYGQQISDAVSTFTDSRDRAGKLIERVLDVYPKRALEVDVKKWSITADEYNNPVFNLNYIVYWNRNFLDSFQDAAAATQNGTTGRGASNSSAIVFGNIPRSVWSQIKQSLGFQNLSIYTYTDSVIYENLQIQLETERFPFLLIEFVKGDTIVHSVCRQVKTDELYYFGYSRRYLMINKNGYFHENLKINESSDPFLQKLKTSDTLKFRVTNKTECRRIIHDK